MVKSQTLGWFVWSVNAITVLQPGTCLGQIAVPDLVGLFLHMDAVQFASPGLVEQAEFDLLRVFRKECEINAFAIPVSAQRIWLSGPNDKLCLDTCPPLRHARARIRCFSVGWCCLTLVQS